MPPAVVNAINDHRAALLAREQGAMQTQARAWLQVEQAIQAQTDALALELARTPGMATMGQLARSRRYQALMEQTRDELAKYSDYMEQRIVSGQRDMVTLALQHSAQAVQSVATEAQITVPFNRLPVSAVNNMVGLAGDGSPLHAILADASRVGPDALGQQLVSGIALGRNPVTVARQAIRLGLGQSFTRMQTIARTEQLRVYRETTLQSYANSRVVVGYKRLSARDDRVCPACLMADGQMYPIEHGFDEHPNGRCALIPVLANVPPVQFQTGQQWFEQQPEATQRKILGAGRYDAWQSGKASLSDMVSRDYSNTWGGSLRATRVRDVLAGRGGVVAGMVAPNVPPAVPPAPVPPPPPVVSAVPQRIVEFPADDEVRTFPLEKLQRYEQPSKDWAGSLSEDEYAAMRSYTGNNYKRIRDNISDGNMGRTERDLLAAVERAPKVEDIVWRGINAQTSSYGGTTAAWRQREFVDNIGGFIEWDTVSSASIDPETAANFGNTLFEVKSKTARYINAGSEYAIDVQNNEYEALFLPGSKFRIVGYIEEAPIETTFGVRTRHIVQLEEVVE